MHRWLVTGASGFVGRQLCAEILKRGWQVKAALRTLDSPHKGLESVIVGQVDVQTDWTEALRNVDVVVHLAARVHVMRDDAVDPLSEFRRINTAGTEHLARCVATAGVRRLVYVSSIKVNGESTAPTPALTLPLNGREQNAFSELDDPHPQDPYGISKWEAEQVLQRVAQETGLEVVVVRPPLVYGPGVKGNFINLFSAIYKGIPLPLAGVNNVRSLVYVGNLIDALITCATHPAAAGETYLISDGVAISTAELASEMATALHCRDRTFYFPPAVLHALAALLGRSAQVDRLLGSLRINSQKIRDELGWTPPYTLQQGLRETADWYQSEHPR